MHLVAVKNIDKYLLTCNTSIIYEYVKTFTCIGIPKHWRLYWLRYEIFITFLTFRFSTRGERDTISTMLTVPSDPTTRGHPVVHNWTGLAQVKKSTRFIQLQILTNCFFQNTQESQPIASGHNVIHIPSPISIRGFYYDICDCHILTARAWTPALNFCPYPCTKPKSSKPN